MKPTRTLLVLCLLALSASPVLAQETEITACVYMCTPDSYCDAPCTQNGVWTTCSAQVCNPDPDGDGRWDGSDNCPLNYNPDQADCDGDGAGNVCDGENGIYNQMIIGWQGCLIVDRLHFGYRDQTLHEEALFRDTSACGSPDKWRRRDIHSGNCFPIEPYLSASNCCQALWGSAMCDLVNNNQCH